MENEENHKINIHCGIHTLPQYVKYDHNPVSIIDYEKIIKTVGSNLRTEETVGLGRFTYGTIFESIEDKRFIANKLSKEFNLNILYARYHTDGTFYNLLDGFPGVLFDLYGYIIINHVADMEAIGVSDNDNHNKWLIVNKKLTKLKKTRDTIKNLILKNKNIKSFQIEQFLINQEKQLVIVNKEINEIQEKYRLRYLA